MEQPSVTAPPVATVGPRCRTRRLRLDRFAVATGLAALCWAMIILAASALRAWLA
ncbi:hypothetical protein [Caulobacter sp. FWC2]|uniref:hypothetical protein n=1 Tax=Caulobacter sp. FWC2 TaxID=69664 RepID=UPI001304495B|nr:hypothetical protein [Caulobacter sp. FWC2]